jgi:two-component system cell cycle response regulator
MTSTALVVDDNRVTRMVLSRALRELDVEPLEAENGLRALEMMAQTSVDVVLLDLLMPELDGYGTLERMRADDALRHIPVIVVTAVDDLESVVRCIELGATDYLPKPFDAAILRARITASLAGKRLRDLELEYLEQVELVIRAAAAVEAGEFDAIALDTVTAREDALGGLARTFARMADEVRAREARLQAEVRELRIEIDDAKQSSRVAEITGSDYFKDLKIRAGELRQMVADQDARPPVDPPSTDLNRGRRRREGRPDRA